MPAAASILGNCECCVCPTPEVVQSPSVSVTWVSSVASAPYLCGFEPFIESEGCTRYRSKTISGEFEEPAVSGSSCEYARRYTYSGTVAYGAGSCTITSFALFNAYRQDDPDCETVQIATNQEVDEIANASVSVESPPCAAGKQTTGTATSATVYTVTGCDFTGSGTETLSDPDTVADAIARASGVSYGTFSCAYTGAASGCSFAQSQSSTGTFTVTGLPSTTYTIRIYRVSYPTEDETDKTLSYDDIIVTTDGDGEAGFEYQLPDPSPEYTVCFAGATPLTFSYYLRFEIPYRACYKIQWLERVYDPENPPADCIQGDGDTLKTFTWDRITPSGYDKNDPTTWPKTSTYSVTVSGTDFFAIDCITSECRCDA